MATAGLSKEDAQSLICRAIADGILKFRAKVGQHTTRAIHGGKERVLEEKDFHISPDIQREDFDWEESRPLNSWGSDASFLIYQDCGTSIGSRYSAPTLPNCAPPGAKARPPNGLRGRAQHVEASRRLNVRAVRSTSFFPTACPGKPMSRTRLCAGASV